MMIVALLFGAGLKVIQRGFSHEGRLLSLRLQSVCRYLYNQSVLTGKVHRLVLELHADDPAQATIGFEVAGGEYVHGNPAAAADSLGTARAGARESTEPASDEPPVDAPAAKAKSTLIGPTRTAFTALAKENGLLAPIKMPTGVTLVELRMAGQKDPVTDGKAYVHFFPQGAVDPAMIVLTNLARDQFFTLQLSPLTGIARISRTAPEGQ